jgi:hypothetical protein
MTIGPYHATGSSIGLPDTSRNRILALQRICGLQIIFGGSTGRGVPSKPSAAACRGDPKPMSIGYPGRNPRIFIPGLSRRNSERPLPYPTRLSTRSRQGRTRKGLRRTSSIPSARPSTSQARRRRSATHFEPKSAASASLCTASSPRIFPLDPPRRGRR